MNETHPAPKRCQLEFGSVEAQLRFLKGKVLTVIDASFPDNTQRKAVRDLISKAFNEQLEHIDQITLSSEDEQFMLNGTGRLSAEERI